MNRPASIRVLPTQPRPIMIPGNMCDGRLWRGGGAAITVALDEAIDAPLLDQSTIADMATATLNAAGPGPLLPVGFSMGAIVALDMARQAPDRIAGLVLIGVNAGADLPERAAHRPQQQAEVRAGGLERVLVEELKPNYLATVSRRDAALLALLRDMGLALGENSFVPQSEALRTRADLTAVLAEFVGPVLLLCGAEDALCPPEWHRRWAALARRAELHVVAGAGHMLPLEAPGAVANIIRNWRERELP